MQKTGSKLISSTVKLKLLSNILDIAEDIINNQEGRSKFFKAEAQRKAKMEEKQE